jgi:hypothetical protein
MGWAAGSVLMNPIIATMRANVPNPVARRRIYRDVIKVFDEHDWDTHGECLGIDPTFDDVLEELHPGILDEDDEDTDEEDEDEDTPNDLEAMGNDGP